MLSFKRILTIKTGNKNQSQFEFLKRHFFSAMERWNLQQRAFVVELFFATNSVIQTQRHFRRRFDTTLSPSRKAILRYVTAFRERGSVGDKPHPKAARPVRTQATISRIREILEMNPSKSLRRLSQQVVHCARRPSPQGCYFPFVMTCCSRFPIMRLIFPPANAV